MEVLYVDNHLLVAVKPAAIATQPHVAGEDNCLDRAKRWVKSTYNKPGNTFLEPIHRLDKPVSGIVLFARTSKALSRLQSQMREHAIEKTYIGLIEGELPSEEGVLEHFLVHGSHRAIIVPPNHPEAKRARLGYRLMKRSGKGSVIEITLETGRYHQIRAQCAHIGCPIIGDSKYGSAISWKPGAIALHHAKMVVKHPVLEKKFVFESSAEY